ncbi:MAG: hypothetical protein SNJ56_06195, partial [Termitinemataceae bacterium]
MPLYSDTSRDINFKILFFKSRLKNIYWKGNITVVYRKLLPVFLIIGALAWGEDQLMLLGGKAGWEVVADMKQVEVTRQGRSYPAITLSSRKILSAPADLWLSFDQKDSSHFIDEQGRYSLLVSSSVLKAGSLQARNGSGAALFTGPVPGTLDVRESTGIQIRPGKNALFASDSKLGDF